MKRNFRRGVVGVLTVLVIGGIGYLQQHVQAEPAEGPQTTKAVAVIHPTQGNTVQGIVTFTQMDNGVHVGAKLSGLPAGMHGFHIHEYGDCSAPDGTSTGGHFNPENKQHGGPDGMERHAGDLGNITADEAGNATLDRVDTHLALSGSASIIGRGLIIHAKADDMTSQPTGDAGARLGCGVIGIGK